MKTVFADAGYWLAPQNPRDELHDRAKQVSRDLGAALLLTSELVFAEVLNGLSGHGAELRYSTAAFVRRLRENKNVSIEPMSTRLFLDALDFYALHRDKEWGFVDCASFVVMNRSGVREALAYDSHFEQAGFIALLRS